MHEKNMLTKIENLKKFMVYN